MKPVETQLDVAWAIRIKELHGHVCAKCESSGGGYPLESHHICGRGRSVRWDLDNGICLCRKCHQWQQGNVAAFLHWISEVYMKPAMHDALVRLSSMVVKRTDTDLRNLLHEIRSGHE